MTLKIFVVVVSTSAALFAPTLFAQQPPKDSNTDIGHPVQTDKVLLRDGSEKQHITKKVKGAPGQKPAEKQTPPPTGLPTDVD